jgi:hypothetical protein
VSIQINDLRCTRPGCRESRQFYHRLSRTLAQMVTLPELPEH